MGEYMTKYSLSLSRSKISASEFKDDKAKLASMLFDIKRYKDRTGNGEELRGLYDEYVKENGYADDIQAEAELLSEEVFLLYSIISTIQQEAGGTVPAVAQRLGLGNGYSYEGHLKNGLSSFISESDKKKNDNEQKNIVSSQFHYTWYRATHTVYRANRCVWQAPRAIP